METEYITGEFFNFLDNGKTKIAKRVRAKMDEDIMSIIKYGNYFWFEKTCSWVVIPNYVLEYAKQWAKNVKKLQYNYDL
jgi:hypothetical protein